MTLADISYPLAFLVLVGLPVSAGYIFSRIINWEKAKYLEDIIFLEAAIKNKEVNVSNYLFIAGKFVEISRNDCNRKRTLKAKRNFEGKYREILKELAA